MRDINNVELHDGDYIKLSRHSENIYQYIKRNVYLKKITGKQNLEVALFTHNGKMAVVKVDKEQWERQNQKSKRKSADNKHIA